MKKKRKKMEKMRAFFFFLILFKVVSPQRQEIISAVLPLPVVTELGHDARPRLLRPLRDPHVFLLVLAENGPDLRTFPAPDRGHARTEPPDVVVLRVIHVGQLEMLSSANSGL